MGKEAQLSIPFSWNQQSYLAHCKAAEKRKDCEDCGKGDTAKKLRCAYKPHTEGKCPELSQRLTVSKTFSTAHVSSKWRCGTIVIETSWLKQNRKPFRQPRNTSENMCSILIHSLSCTAVQATGRVCKKFAAVQRPVLHVPSECLPTLGFLEDKPR